ncbi:CBM-containing protein, putative [Thermococcus sp. 2319x1]|uniref:hypothetical protein n=1 Tax=Thermococcus sp. 2319x1 TaxID=1674923 RepID=UPI00073AC493|nr:hypothetical protein [Thermococcus sp. 2319x1]ALV62209.1 CBM-containing protein, putative [Thermococcus sp. 2319x1]
MERLVVFMLLFLLPFAYAQELEYLTWGGDEIDSGVAYLPGEGYSILVGSTKSFEDLRGGFIVKVDDKGGLEFQKLIYSSKPIFIRDATLYGDKTYLVGQIGSINFQDADAFVGVLNVNGELVYFKTFGGSFNDGAEAMDIANDRIYIVGYTSPTGSIQRAFLAELSLEGKVNWVVEFGNENAKATAVKATQSLIYVAGTYDKGIFVCAFDLIGRLRWAKAYPLKDVEAIEFKNDVYVAGSTKDDIGFGNAFLLRISQNGDTIWKKHFGIGYGDNFVSIMFNNSEIVLLGYTGNFTSGNRDGIISKFDETGELQWFGIIQGGKEDIVAKGILKDGVIYAAGYTEDFSKRFIVPNVSKVTWETLYGPLDIPEGEYSPEPKKITLESSDYKVLVKTVSGRLNSPKNGDAWFFKFGKEKSEVETTTKTSVETSPSISTTSTTQTTAQSPSPPQTTSTPSTTTKKETSSSEITSPTATPSTTSSATTSEESKGICGPSIILLFTMASLLWRHLKR